jgi:hypothetical protein
VSWQLDVAQDGVGRHAEQLGEASWRHMKFSYLEDELGSPLSLERSKPRVPSPPPNWLLSCRIRS